MRPLWLRQLLIALVLRVRLRKLLRRNEFGPRRGGENGELDFLMQKSGIHADRFRENLGKSRLFDGG